MTAVENITSMCVSTALFYELTIWQNNNATMVAAALRQHPNTTTLRNNTSNTLLCFFSSSVSMFWVGSMTFSLVVVLLSRAGCGWVWVGVRVRNCALSAPPLCRCAHFSIFLPREILSRCARYLSFSVVSWHEVKKEKAMGCFQRGYTA